jgi:hypothetical protein
LSATRPGAACRASGGASFQSRLLFWFALGCVSLVLSVAAQGSGRVLYVTGRPASAGHLSEVAGTPVGQDLNPGGQLHCAGGTIRNLDLPQIPTRVLAFSDHPERVRGRGLLFQAGLLRFAPVRFQYYHEGGCADGPLFLSVRLRNRGSGPAHVHLIQGAAGPDPDYFAAGHRNNQIFLRRLVAFEGRVEVLAPGDSVQVALHRLPYEQVVSGTLQMTLLEGRDLEYALFAMRDPAEPIGFDLLSNPQDVHARGIYPAADQVLERSWEVGPTPGLLAFGALRQPNILAGPELKGDYGVVIRAELRLINPSDQAQKVEFCFNPRGGPATGTFLARVDGNPVLDWSVPHPVSAFVEFPLAVLEVPARGQTLLILWTIPEGASNYPVRVLWRLQPTRMDLQEECRRGAGSCTIDHVPG